MVSMNPTSKDADQNPCGLNKIPVVEAMFKTDWRSLFFFDNAACMSTGKQTLLGSKSLWL